MARHTVPHPTATRHVDDFMRAQGLELEEVGPGRVILHLPQASDSQRGGGIPGSKSLNGGVLAYMFDGALGYAVISALRAKPEARTVDLTQVRHFTMGLNISYLEPALGDRFAAHADVVRVSRNTAFAEGRFVDGAGTVCATANGIFRVVWPRS